MRGKLTMQSVHETYIVPTLRFNNIALLMVMWLSIPIAARYEDLVAEERIRPMRDERTCHCA